MTYTDGHGTIGEGSWEDGTIRRGPETSVERPTDLTIAVAPPKQKDRVRFIVEKAQELGVAALRWIETDHGEIRIPPPNRTQAWAVGALEQSRGAWLMEVDGPVALDTLGQVIACDASGMAPDAKSWAAVSGLPVAIGPEGGWSEAELAGFGSIVTLGPTTLRVETAVVVAVSLLARAGG